MPLPEYTISEADHPVELYSALFQTMTDVDGAAIAGAVKIGARGVSPLVNGRLRDILKRPSDSAVAAGRILEDRRR